VVSLSSGLLQFVSNAYLISPNSNGISPGLPFYLILQLSHFQEPGSQFLKNGKFSLDFRKDIYILRHLSMKKTDTLQGSLDLLVLTILSRRPKLHGYALMTAIKETSGEVLSPEEGSLYPALHRMEEAGWISAEWVVKENGKRARIYRLTAAGKKQLAMEEARWTTVSLAINRVLREA
jgi:PadR family transcriptional regulator PadR